MILPGEIYPTIHQQGFVDTFPHKDHLLGTTGGETSALPITLHFVTGASSGSSFRCRQCFAVGFHWRACHDGVGILLDTLVCLDLSAVVFLPQRLLVFFCKSHKYRLTLTRCYETVFVEKRIC